MDDLDVWLQKVASSCFEKYENYNSENRKYLVLAAVPSGQNVRDIDGTTYRWAMSWNPKHCQALYHIRVSLNQNVKKERWKERKWISLLTCCQPPLVPQYDLVKKTHPSISLLRKTHPSISLVRWTRPSIFLLRKTHPSISLLRKTQSSISLLKKARPSTYILVKKNTPQYILVRKYAF